MTTKTVRPEGVTMAAAHEHGDGHGHDGRIVLMHATAPTCWWSWGYEAVLNRMRMVYGDQIRYGVFYATVYEDLEEYKKHYEVDDAGMREWTKEAIELMGVPMHDTPQLSKFPKSMLPATIAVLAAMLQGHEKGERFFRALLRRFVVEDRDVTKEAELLDAAKEAGVDGPRLLKEMADGEARHAQMEAQGEGFPGVGVGFYNLAVTDGHGTTVMLDHAFDPAKVEAAIDFVSGGKLKKSRPKDLVGYVRKQGPTPLVEVARVFGLSGKDAEAELSAYVKKGELATVTLAGATFWKAGR